MLNDCSRLSMHEIWEDDRKAATAADIISAWHRVHSANRNGDISVSAPFGLMTLPCGLGYSWANAEAARQRHTNAGDVTYSIRNTSSK